MSWTDEDEVIARANNTNYGLGASVWSSDTARAMKISRQIEAGTVWINTHFDLDPMLPFGGHKESGIGVEFGVGGESYPCLVAFFLLVFLHPYLAHVCCPAKIR
jgi:acyl-CoA reductase-like NAD-dependent aldehyde dehydrogenase